MSIRGLQPLQFLYEILWVLGGPEVVGKGEGAVQVVHQLSKLFLGSNIHMR